MTDTELRFRQIHLDFHTSEAIEGIGAKFDADRYAETLEKAAVDSITTFARGHHGWLYYDSKAFPERIHPHLTNRNLLKEQIEACHARNIRVPIYITVQWDYYTSMRHPEWCAIEEDGKIMNGAPLAAGFYRFLCVNTPYRDFLKAQTREVLETLPTDGLFFDIVQPRICLCRQCRETMLSWGLDPSNKKDQRNFAQEMINEFKRDMTRFVRQYNTDCTIFYNRGHVGPAHRPVQEAYTHFELESLPSGGWGYIHFPLSIRFARTLGIDCMGMTGKFHTSWGDFHSYKNQAALEYECFNMLAQGAKCSIGDQLLPDGRLDKPTYDLIGAVYRQVRDKEPWCGGVEAVTDIGVMTPEEFEPEARISPPLAGAVQMLTESGHQFDVIDSKANFSKYKVLVLPDKIVVSKKLARALEAYVKKGGKILATYESGLDEAGEDFALKALGVRKDGDGEVGPDGQLVRGRMHAHNAYTDYVLPKGIIGRGLPKSEHAMYMRGLSVKAEKGSTVMSWCVEPHFDRTWRHFCSHAQAPSSGKKGGAAVVRKGDCIYFRHPIFLQFWTNGPEWCKTMLLNALDELLPERLVRYDGPSTLEATLQEQKAEKRYVLHMLHYIPERRSQQVDLIKDVIPLYGVQVSVAAPHKVRAVTLQPEGEPLKFTESDGRIEFTVPAVKGHQMVVLER